MLRVANENEFRHTMRLKYITFSGACSTPNKYQAQIFTQLDCHNFTVLHSLPRSDAAPALEEIIYADRFQKYTLSLARFATYARSFEAIPPHRANLWRTSNMHVKPQKLHNVID